MSKKFLWHYRWSKKDQEEAIKMINQMDLELDEMTRQLEEIDIKMKAWVARIEANK